MRKSIISGALLVFSVIALCGTVYVDQEGARFRAEGKNYTYQITEGSSSQTQLLVRAYRDTTGKNDLERGWNWITNRDGNALSETEFQQISAEVYQEANALCRQNGGEETVDLYRLEIGKQREGEPGIKVLVVGASPECGLYALDDESRELFRQVLLPWPN